MKKLWNFRGDCIQLKILIMKRLKICLAFAMLTFSGAIAQDKNAPLLPPPPPPPVELLVEPPAEPQKPVEPRLAVPPKAPVPPIPPTPPKPPMAPLPIPTEE